MKVILLSDVRKVGRKGTVVEVSPGYAANMLFPKGLATPATEERLRVLAEAETKKQAEAASKDAALMRMVQSLQGAVLTIPIRATPQGGLFKSVDVKAVVKAIRMERSLEIPDQMVHLEETIRTVGDHKVPLLYKTAKVEVTVRIVREV